MSPVKFTIDVTRDAKPISRFIYGVNQKLAGPYAHCPLTRCGGNRWTAYNWTNNASNAGNDWQFQNDNLLGGGDVPGGAVIPALENAASAGAGILITIPINGYVAADHNGGGDVHRSGPDYLKNRFRPEQAKKNGPFTLTPALDSPVVYQDEFVNWIKQKFPAGFSNPRTPIWFDLDNEPDLWPSTHKEVHPSPTTYAEIIEKNVEYARAIKQVAPSAKVFGPVSYGWQGFINLQNAPDANGRDFLEFYLREMAAAQKTEGKRLVDTMDVHWYPEARGEGIRVTGQESAPAVAASRMQGPRSLWDPSYTETSWITQWSTKGPIELLPRLRKKIESNNPGTQLAMSEYNFGGGGHISGAIAEADALGIFGREGMLAACEWPMTADESFIAAAFQMYVDFDGNGAAFGDTSVHVENNNVADSSVYASVDSMHPNRLVLVAINKTAHPTPVLIHIDHGAEYRKVRVFQLTADKHQPLAGHGANLLDANVLAYSMPATSVSTIEIE